MFFTDQSGYQISLDYTPLSIVSLVPSQTELLSQLGLDHEVTGITRFCVHPHDWQSRKTIIGGTKTFQFSKIDDLKPDLIIGNKEENYREGIEQLRQKYPVWISDIYNLADSLAMIRQVGALTNRIEQAGTLADDIACAFKTVVPWQSQSVLYLIWRKPWMAAGYNTFIDAMLRELGLENVVKDDRYPELSTANLTAMNPKYVFLSSEPYPFTAKHIAEIQTACPNSKIMLVDGEMFSWYGSRLLQAPAYFNQLRQQSGTT